MPPKPKQFKVAGGDSPGKKKMEDENTEGYRKKRDRNNIAVKKSRERSKQKARETMEKVDKLKKENKDLEMKVQVLTKELSLLKDLFLSHAGSIMPREGEIKVEDHTQVRTMDLGSNGESDDSNSSCADGYSGAGSLANAEAVQRDHEYSASPMFVGKSE